MKITAVLAAALVFSSILGAQSVTGSLSGTVQDTAGAVLPGAEVKLTNEQGFIRSVKTNGSGFFSFPDLTSSTFSLSISAPGFKRYQQTGIEVLSGVQRSVGTLTLQLGELSDSVTVTAEAVAVETGSSEKAGSLTSKDFETMALRGRDFMDAVTLMAGVVDTSDSREAPSPTSMGGIYILGGRDNSKNMTIDGITNLDTGSNGSVHTMPSMDSVGELKVLLSNYAAEYGRNSGGSITVITKGGVKDFHATAGWYYRHESFSANNFFNNRNGQPRAPYRYNIGSYTVSGPVYLPWKQHKSDAKIFFFFSQEFQRQKVNYGSKTITVPTALEREGDFSATRDVNGNRPTIWDSQNNRVGFPNNVIPKSRLSPMGLSILKMLPMPNFVDPAASRRYQWNYISEATGSYPRRTETARIDWSPRQNTQIYGRISNNFDEQHPYYTNWTTGSVNFPLTPIVFRQPGQGAVIHGTTVLTPTIISDTTFGVSINRLTFFPQDENAVTKKALGLDIPQWYPSQNAAGYIPNMTFSGGVPNPINVSMNNGIPYKNANTIISLVENVSKIAGTHSFKAGVYIERTRKDQSASTATRGTLNFDRTSQNPLDANWEFANAALGVYRTYAEATGRPRALFRFTNFEWYAQDAWRVRRNLMIDFGLRFYADGPQYDQRNQLASFNIYEWKAANAPVLLRPAYDATKTKVALDPTTGQMYPQGLIGTFAPGKGNPANGMVVPGVTPGYSRTPYTIGSIYMAPRLGFSWDPSGKGKTAIRGGAGVYYDRIMGNPTMDLINNPPTVFTPSVYYGELEHIADAAGKGILAPGSVGSSLLGAQATPTTYNYSFGIQQQVSRTIFTDISYVGSISRHQLWKRNINATPMGSTWTDVHPENIDPTNGTNALPTNFLRPITGYGDINMFEFGSTSNYNSFQASASRRMRNGFLLSFAYTFSKVLGSANSDTSSVEPFLPPRYRNYGPVSFDRTHVASIRYFWSLPKPGKRYGIRPLGIVTDGWELSGTGRFQTGGPFTPTFAQVNYIDITGSSQGARISVGDPNAPEELRYVRPAKGTWGNAGVNTARNPGMNVWDTTLARTIRIHERLQLKLRVESYNTYNHTQFNARTVQGRFSGPDQIDPLFLTYSGAANPRRLQFAMQMNW